MTRHASRFLAVALCALASATVARANCIPLKPFGQSGQTQYHYVVFPPGTPATSQSIVGRFWQPGQFQGTNQGTCDDSRWLYPATSTTFWINGTIGSNECFTPGCMVGEMILLLEERGPQGGIFAVARVDEWGGWMNFDFSRLERDIVLASLPRPHVTSTQHVGSLNRVSFRFDDPAPGFYGLQGVPATGTITAINLYSRVAATPDPLERSGWTFRARFPYAGGETTGTVDFGDGEFCPGGGFHFALAAALELDSGQVVTDYVSAPLAPACIPETSTGASRVPEEGDDALHVGRDPSGALSLTWGAACFPLGARYSVYEGTIGDWTSHAPRSCAASGTTALLTPAPDSSYYLVVPYATNTGPPGDFEGSYGLLRDGTERGAAASACAPRWVQDCP